MIYIVVGDIPHLATATLQLLCRYLLCAALTNHLVEVCSVILTKLFTLELPFQAKYPLLHHREVVGQRYIGLKLPFMKGNFRL